MSDQSSNDVTRRDMLKNTGRVAAATAVAGMALPRAYAAEDNTIQLALVGCGNRGGGAAKNALSVSTGPTRLVAMADVFEHRQSVTFNALNAAHADQMDVPQERRFIGFDAYRHAMDALDPGDVERLEALGYL